MGSTNVRLGSTIFGARQPKQPSSANVAGGILQQSLGKQCYPVGPPNPKRPKEQTHRNKALFLRKVSMSTSGDNVCDKNSGFARCRYM